MKYGEVVRVYEKNYSIDFYFVSQLVAYSL